MHVSVLREVVALLADGAAGVNATRSALPRPGGEPAPAAVTLYDALAHGWAARQQVPDTIGVSTPAVVVTFGGGTTTQAAPAGQFPAAQVAVQVQVVIRNDTTTTAVRDAWNLARIAHRVLSAPWQVPHATRERDGVSLHAPTFSWPAGLVTEGDDLVACGFQAAFPVTDGWAIGGVA